MRKKNEFNFKDYLKASYQLLGGLSVIAVGCMVIFYLFESPAGGKWYHAALAIAAVSVFWFLAGGLALVMSWIFRKLKGT